ncbi:hypothetical protein BDV93DRAFT_527033, partial [Ceratobasidium sp. AG-I]
MSATHAASPPILHRAISTSELAGGRHDFRAWADAVNLRLSPTWTFLPAELQALHDQALVLPTWVAEDNSTHFFPIFNPLRALLRAGAPTSTIFEDNDTNRVLHLAMPDIIRTSAKVHELFVDLHKLEYCKADFRKPLDNLIELVWEPSCEEKMDWMSVLSERTLALPDTRNTSLPFLCVTTTSDSVSCIQLERSLELFQPMYSSFSKRILTPVLPHCIAEFNMPMVELEVSIRQVQLGMVSALYQRRALGYPRQFVFGIAHQLGTFVLLLAARWESSPDIIHVYTLGEFDLQRPYKAVRFYLLLRATLTLAKKYKKEIEDKGLRNAIEQPWAAPLPKRPNLSSLDGSKSSGSVCDNPSGNTVSLALRDCDRSSLDELPMDLGSDRGLSREALAGFVEIDHIDKCRSYLGL